MSFLPHVKHDPVSLVKPVPGFQTIQDIVKRFEKTGSLPIPVNATPVYGDVSTIGDAHASLCEAKRLEPIVREVTAKHVKAQREESKKVPPSKAPGAAAVAAPAAEIGKPPEETKGGGSGV